MNFVLLLGYLLIGYTVASQSTTPQCFKLKFGEISCNQAVGVNTILKTVPNDCLQSKKGLELLKELKEQGNDQRKRLENIEKSMKAHNNDHQKDIKSYKKLYEEEKKKNAALNSIVTDQKKTITTLKDKVTNLEEKVKQKNAKVEQVYFTKAQLKKCGIGMQNIHKIIDSRITAKSIYGGSANVHYQPFYSRLFGKRKNRCWYPKSNNVNEWIQVDLGQDRVVNGIATQGCTTSYWVKSYRVLYQTSTSNTFLPIRDTSGNAVVFKGNNNSGNNKGQTPVVNVFGHAIKARWFRINPLSWHSWITLRFDLIVCKKPTDEVVREKGNKVVQKHYTKAQLEFCGVGLQSVDVVRNDQITASSTHPLGSTRQAAYNGRLFATTGYVGWGCHYNRANEWIQVDLKEDKTIYGVATQGRPRPVQYVRSYNVLYKPNGSNSFLPVTNESGEPIKFQGNRDGNTVVHNSFPRPITGRYFRISVLTWTGWICLRFDLLTC